jgi:hypothetical protein
VRLTVSHVIPPPKACRGRPSQFLDEALLSDFLEDPESEDFEDEPPSELELLLESEDEEDDEEEEEEEEEDSLLLELSLASFISRERLRVP